jgi:pimeloyl-ACP methyl ester carboxylesterase
MIDVEEFLELAGPTPVVMVHGFRETKHDSIEHFRDVAEKYIWTEYKPSAVVAFTWPSGVKGLAISSIVSFVRAMRRTTKAANFLAMLMISLPPTTRIYAHSLGCRVTLHMAKIHGIQVSAALLAGAACSYGLLKATHQYFGRLVVTRSKSDDILKWLYRLVTGSVALGYGGLTEPLSNVVQIEVSSDHSDYHEDPKVIERL